MLRSLGPFRAFPTQMLRQALWQARWFSHQELKKEMKRSTMNLRPQHQHLCSDPNRSARLFPQVQAIAFGLMRPSLTTALWNSFWNPLELMIMVPIAG
jgi:hypothetical protein